MKRSSLWVVLASGLVCGAAQADAALTNIDQALKVAQARQEPVFVDFSATWCHSCHAMDDKVLNGAEWDTQQSRFVLVRSDADSANGTAWMSKLQVPALPTYIVLNPDGSERGRLSGEFTRARFYPALDRLLSGADALPKLKMDAMRGSTEAIAKVLRACDDREEAPAGIQWYASLPTATRQAVQSDAKTAAQLQVAEMDADKSAIISHMPAWMKAQVKQDSGKSRLAADAEQARLGLSCRGHAQQALAGTLTTEERVDVMQTLLGWCSGDLSPEQKRAQAQAQLPAFQALYDKDVPSGGSSLLREATYTLIALYDDIDDKANEQAAYQRAIAIGRKALSDGHGGFDVKRDQAMAEVLDEFLGRYRSSSDKNEDVALQRALVEAYPDNASYQAEYGESLLKQGHAAAALPYLQHAADTANGYDKLGYTHSLAKALIALNRRPEAEKLFNAALQTAEKQFPKQTRMGMLIRQQYVGKAL